MRRALLLSLFVIGCADRKPEVSPAGDDLDHALAGGEAESQEDPPPEGAYRPRAQREVALRRAISTGVLGSTASPGDTETYRDHGVNAWFDTATDNLSTFAADVDTASYTIVRRKLREGVRPPAAAVRVEELVNYFRYDYPTDGAPFAVQIDAAPSPFDDGRQIVRVGVSTRPKSVRERKPANLVFLVDVSGSMASPDKLDLAKRSLRILVDNLKDGDTVALVTYAGSTRVVLEPTGLDRKNEILSAIEDLTAGGSTAMASGIELAYQQAAKMNKGDVVSRVIVLSDGDANVGATSHEEILHSIEGQVREGVTLSTIGFGMGNYKDETMEQLANRGNGNNYYIDSLSHARHVFQEQLGATLEVVAKDVKLQLEWNAPAVKRYRLLGYENRDIADDDFREDEVDAGEIGAGHQVTALYEIELATGAAPRDLLTVRVRHKEPEGTDATESAFTMPPDSASRSFDGARADLRFAFAVAAFAEVLRGSDHARHWELPRIREIAAAAAGNDADRLELVALIDRAITLH